MTKREMFLNKWCNDTLDDRIEGTDDIDEVIKEEIEKFIEYTTYRSSPTSRLLQEYLNKNK